MPQLGITSKSVKLVLPSTTDLPEEEQAWVILNRHVHIGMIAESSALTEDPVKLNIGLLSHAITDWNYTDEAGVKVPITQETVSLLDYGDFLFIAQNFNEALPDGEKKKSDTLPVLAIPGDATSGESAS